MMATMRLFRGRDGLVCPECGVAHERLVTVFGPEAPDAWVEAPLASRVQGELGRDQCFLPWQRRLFTFIRGHVVVPVSDRPGETFAWSVWSTLAPDDMETIEEHRDDPRRGDLPAMAGRLANALPYEESTLGLSLRVLHREPGQVPSSCSRRTSSTLGRGAAPRHPLASSRRAQPSAQLRRITPSSAKVRICLSGQWWRCDGATDCLRWTSKCSTRRRPFKRGLSRSAESAGRRWPATA